MAEIPRIIAYYLPQFHPIEENNKWWGNGFTEWTNVAKSKPLFKGHRQPNIPADLGFYDLRLPESREAQADLAKEYGIEGFCYWYYWFGNGKRLLDRPLNEVAKSGSPNFPFCIGWANHSWTTKTWTNSTMHRSMIMEQLYLGQQSYEKFFYEVLPLFKDKRYISVNNKPIFVVFDPLSVPDMPSFLELWRKLAIENGLDGIYFVGYVAFPKTKDRILDYGFDAVNIVPIQSLITENYSTNRFFKKILKEVFRIPYRLSYKKAIRKIDSEIFESVKYIPSIIPNYDDTPRRGYNGFILSNSTPYEFGIHVQQVINHVNKKPHQERLIFVKSWNEWGEGNYLEPDLYYGRAYLEQIREKLLVKE